MSTFDVFAYRKIILNNLCLRKNNIYIIVNEQDLKKNITHYKIQDNEYVIGYYIKTINGLKYMPVFNHKLGRVKNNVNKEFKEIYKEYLVREKKRKIDELYNIGLPLEICLLIYSFI